MDQPVVSKNLNPANARGFTLVEMALVLLIIGLLTKTAVGPLAGVMEHRKRTQAEQTLLMIRESIFAHVVAYGAIPCPLIASASGAYSMSNQIAQLANVSDKSCEVASGFIPAHGLRLAGAVSSSGALLDPWGREYRYAVSLEKDKRKGSAEIPYWITPGEAAVVGVGDLTADLVLCNASSGANCNGRAIRSDQIVFVILSAGGDASAEGLQSENLDNDNYFTVTDESVVTGSQYDDIVAWGSAADVMYWMLRMGWLP